MAGSLEVHIKVPVVALAGFTVAWSLIEEPCGSLSAVWLSARLVTRLITFTLQVAVRLLPSVVAAVMVAVPTSRPLTTPSATVAALVLLLVQVITWLSAPAGVTTG